MGVAGGPDIIRDSSLILNLNAAYKNSYPGSGTTWYDVSGNGNDSLISTGEFDSTGNYLRNFTNASNFFKYEQLGLVVYISLEELITL